MVRSVTPSGSARRHPAPRAGRAALLLAGALWAPALLAQGETQPADSAVAEQTHQVRRGDTLWDLARAYLSSPYEWPAIYQLNGDRVKDPHWIYPGETLRIPGGVASAPEPEVPDDAVYERPGSNVVAAVVASVEVVARRAVREREVYAAPWVDRAGGPARVGETQALVEPAGIAYVSETHQRLQLHDRVYATVPEGATPTAGALYVSMAPGATVGTDGQIMVPTAVLEAEQAGRGRAATMRVVQIYDDVRLGQRLVPLTRFSVPAGVTPAQQETGPAVRVVAIPRDPVLPTLLTYVVLDVTSRAGLAVGDQVTLFRDPPANLANASSYPEEPIALLQVVRVTERGTTAIVVNQRHPGIRPGARGRVTAKMP